MSSCTTCQPAVTTATTTTKHSSTRFSDLFDPTRPLYELLYDILDTFPRELIVLIVDLVREDVRVLRRLSNFQHRCLIRACVVWPPEREFALTLRG
jgi:hypothetical protein